MANSCPALSKDACVRSPTTNRTCAGCVGDTYNTGVNAMACTAWM